MKRFKLFGPTTQLTEIASEIMAEDLTALSKRAAKGWDINRPFELCEYMFELPITLALVENKLLVLDWLLERRADLNAETDPSVVSAVKNCAPEVVEKLVAHGAKVDRFDRVGKSAYSSALYSDRYDLLPLLLRLGLPIDVDRGVSLRQAVFNEQFEAVRFFIENGLDANARVPDMVFPSNPTAVAVAAMKGSLETVRYLVEHGADISVKDDFGDRPYSFARTNNDATLMAYLKAMEDPQLHDVEKRAQALREYGLPLELVAFLRSDNRRIEIEGHEPAFVELYDVLGVREMRWEGRMILDLVEEADDRWATGLLVWSLKDQKLAHADYEYGKFIVLCTWQKFLANPGKWTDLIFS